MGLRSGRARNQATLFQNDEYTRLLNQLLLLELGTVDLYRRCQQYLVDCGVDTHGDRHRLAAQTLVNLIVANRGIPNREGTALPAEISILAFRVCHHFSDRVATQTARRICLTMEKLLRRRYHAAINQAPLRDRGYLKHLIHLTKIHIDQLEAERSLM
jgi:hypothetical protein